MTSTPVTFQINLAPPDLGHARDLLPHQLRQIGGQVAEVLLAVDTRRPTHGRFAARWEENADALDGLIADLAAACPAPVRVHRIDYSPSARRETARIFFDTDDIPDKDYRGGPYYAYFNALAAATHDTVFHIDSDMILGGGSQTWIAEAVALLESEERIVFVGPLPGPPTPDGHLKNQDYALVEQDRQARRYDFDHMSTRVFMFRRSKLLDRLGSLHPDPAPLKQRLLGWAETGSGAMLPEILYSVRMRERGARRVDFLGTGSGMWSLHPPFRVPEFYEKLPAVIRMAEHNETFPEAQAGFYDLSDAMVDWNPARVIARRNRWWRRLGRKWLRIG